MYGSIVLNIDFVTDPDGINVSSDHGIEPNAATLSSYHITHDGCIRSKVVVFSKLRDIPLTGKMRAIFF